MSRGVRGAPAGPRRGPCEAGAPRRGGGGPPARRGRPPGEAGADRVLEVVAEGGEEERELLDVGHDAKQAALEGQAVGRLRRSARVSARARMLVWIRSDAASHEETVASWGCWL